MGSRYKEGRRSGQTQKKRTPDKPERVFEFPSNVRQIGGINKGIKIYIEDYAYTYISKIGAKAGKDDTAVFLVGFPVAELGEDILVIMGAIKPPFTQPPADGEVFSESDRQYAKETIEKYFPELEIVGWARIQPGYGLYLSASDISSHFQSFSDKDMVLFLYDPEEKQNCFFTWNDKQDDLCEAAGYFIFYEKNNEMNAYISEMKKPFGKNTKASDQEAKISDSGKLEVDEMVIEDFGEDRQTALYRSVENAKRLAEIQRQKRIISMMTSVSILLFFACVIMGVGLLQNGERISLMETQMRELRTGYNNIVSKINEGVLPAFAAQPESLQQTENTAAEIEALIASKIETAKNEPMASDEPNIDKDLGITEEPAAEANEGQTAEPEKYVVQQGDTLTYISNKFYGVPGNVGKIMEANGISDPNKLYVGTTLIIPMD